MARDEARNEVETQEEEDAMITQVDNSWENDQNYGLFFESDDEDGLDNEEELDVQNEKENSSINKEQNDSESSLGVDNGHESEQDLHTESFLSGYESEDRLGPLNESDSDFEVDPLKGWSNVREFVVPENLNSHFRLQEHAVFETVDEFRKVLKEYTIREGVKIKRIKNERTRIHVVCAARNCQWRVFASLLPDDMSFMIKRPVPDHTCIRVDNLKEACSNWLATKLVPILTSHPDMKNKSLKIELKKLYGVEPQYMQLYRAKLKAIDIIEGHPSESYKLMPQYKAMVQETNPGSIVEFQYYLDKEGRIPIEPAFKRVFIGLDGLKRGFLDGCAPFLGLDGCHLKGKYKGILLSAVSIDPNLGLYPIAFAVVETENKDSWLFFLYCLKQMLGGFCNDKPWTFMSDRQKGLEFAMQDVAPNVVHRKCCRHIYSNMRPLHPGVLVKKLFWAAAKAYTESEFKAAMNRLKDMKPLAYKYLIEVGDFSLWARHAFNRDILNDHVTNNITESFNAWIGDLRSAPIHKLVDGLRAKIMHRIESRYQKGKRWEGVLCKRVVKRVNIVKEEAQKCEILVGGSYEFQVNEGGRHFIVDLKKKECHCRVWDITGIPCRHVAKAISHKRHEIESYVHPKYYKETYIRVYNHKIKGITAPNFWPEMDDIHPKTLLPPEIKRLPGRPKKHRRRELGEEPRAIPSRRRRNVKCGVCGQRGHNKRSCTSANGAQQQATSQFQRAEKRGKGRGKRPTNHMEGTKRNQRQRMSTNELSSIQFFSSQPNFS